MIDLNTYATIKDKYPSINKSFYIIKKNGILQIQDNGRNGAINAKTIDLIVQADKLFGFNDLPLTLILTDGWNTVEKEASIRKKIANPYIKILSSSGTEEMGEDYLIPDYNFIELKEKKLGELISKAGEKKWEKNQIGWSGKIFTFCPTKDNYAPRIILSEFGKAHSKIIDCQFIENLNPNERNLIKLPQQILNPSFKYCMDIEGYGYGGDLKYLLYSKRVCFLQYRPWHEWYYYNLKPYVHYIPVKRDLSDLVKQYKWIEQNSEEYEKIANSAYEFACEHVTFYNALNQLKEVFSRLTEYNKTRGYLRPEKVIEEPPKEAKIQANEIGKQKTTPTEMVHANLKDITPSKKETLGNQAPKSPYHNLGKSVFVRFSDNKEAVSLLDQSLEPKKIVDSSNGNKQTIIPAPTVTKALKNNNNELEQLEVRSNGSKAFSSKKVKQGEVPANLMIETPSTETIEPFIILKRMEECLSSIQATIKTQTPELNKQYLEKLHAIKKLVVDSDRKINNLRLSTYAQQLNKPPIIIGGCARSGTTLLLSMLSAHSEVLAISTETGAFCPGGYSKNPDLTKPFNLKRFYHFLWMQPLEIQHKRWIEKMPKNILFFDRILDYFGGDVKLIQIVRDGRDVILSKHPSNANIFWVHPNRWINDVSAGIKFLDNPKIYTVKYEDLILNYEKTMMALSEYLDLPNDYHLKNWHLYAKVRTNGSWEGEVKNIFSDSIGKWKKEEYKDRIQNFINHPKAAQLLEKYGYI